MVWDRRRIVENFEELFNDRQSRPVLLVAGICTFCLFFLVYCVSVTRSLVLMGCAWLTLFSILSLVAGLASVTVRRRNPGSLYTFGLARAPVLSVFASTVLLQLAALFLVKESIERLLEGDEHKHPSGLVIPGTIAAVVSQLLAAYAVNNEPLNHVLTAASSSWLQEHMADFSHAICRVVPGLSRFLLPRLNSLGLLVFCGGASCFLTHLLLEHNGVWWADAVGALCLSAAVMGSMWPLSAYTGRIMLQTSPPHILAQLERCLREASTLDGVLELTGAHFWQLDFGRMAGTVNVRVRRDADEQLVLAHVTDRLVGVVTDLTVQVIKDADFETLAGGYRFDDGAHGHSHDENGHGHSHEGHGHSHEEEHENHSHEQQAHGHSHGGSGYNEQNYGWNNYDSHKPNAIDNYGHGHSHNDNHNGHSHDH